MGGTKGTQLMERSAYKNPDNRIENTNQGRLGNKNSEKREVMNVDSHLTVELTGRKEENAPLNPVLLLAVQLLRVVSVGN